MIKPFRDTITSAKTCKQQTLHKSCRIVSLQTIQNITKQPVMRRRVLRSMHIFLQIVYAFQRLLDFCNQGDTVSSANQVVVASFISTFSNIEQKPCGHNEPSASPAVGRFSAPSPVTDRLTRASRCLCASLTGCTKGEDMNDRKEPRRKEEKGEEDVSSS